jgi:hypothetical protein
VGEAADGEPAGVVVEAADLRVRVSGFKFGGRPCLADLEGGGGGSRRTGSGGNSTGSGGAAAR